MPDIAIEARNVEAKAYAISQLQTGMDRTTVIKTLMEEMGMGNGEASEIVAHSHAVVIKAAEAERFTFNSLLPAVAGGSLAALVGGGIWATIAIVTNMEIGYVALGIGLLAGYSVVFFSKGKKGLPLQLIAVGASIGGIIVGKYAIFYDALKEAVLNEAGPSALTELSLVGGKTLELFADNIGSLLSPYDILWVGLAVVSAWKIPRASGLQIAE